MIRVMIVEDDPMVASVNETYLCRLPGFCVIAKSADGLQALEKIKALSGSSRERRSGAPRRLHAENGRTLFS